MAILSTIQGIRDETATRLNETESDFTDTYTNWINQCIRDIYIDFPNAPFARTSADRTLSSGTRIYTNLPSDFEKMNSVVYPAGDVKLTYLEPLQFDIFQPSATEGGNPAYYTIRGTGDNGRIEFYPSPGSNLTLHYDYQKAPLTVSIASAQIVSAFPLKYIELPVLYNQFRGLQRRGRNSESQQVQAEYERLKEKMRNELKNMTTENTRIRSEREFITMGKGFSDPIKWAFWSD